MHSCPAGEEENSVESENDLLSIGEECEEWPVQKVKTQTFVQQFVTSFVIKFIYLCILCTFFYSAQCKGRW